MSKFDEAYAKHVAAINEGGMFDPITPKDPVGDAKAIMKFFKNRKQWKPLTYDLNKDEEKKLKHVNTEIYVRDWLADNAKKIEHRTFSRSDHDMAAEVDELFNTFIDQHKIAAQSKRLAGRGNASDYNEHNVIVHKTKNGLILTWAVGPWSRIFVTSEKDIAPIKNYVLDAV